MREGEFYRNVSAELMLEWLKPFKLVLLGGSPADLYAVAFK